MSTKCGAAGVRHKVAVERGCGLGRRDGGARLSECAGCTAVHARAGSVRRARAHGFACHTHRWCCYQSDEVHDSDCGTATVESARARNNAPLFCPSVAPSSLAGSTSQQHRTGVSSDIKLRAAC